MKKHFILFLLGASPALFAAIDVGTYQNETLDSLALNQTNENSTWVFDNVEFTNSGSMSLNNTSNAEYNITLKETQTSLNDLILQRNSGNTFIELQGIASKRSSITISQDWKAYINASKTADSEAKSELKLSGYSDWTSNTFCMSSDAGFISGTTAVDISGASNTFTVAKNTYMGKASQTDAAINASFSISGVEGAKSTANFNGDLFLTSAGTSENQFNMKGNADVTVAKQINIGNDISGGSFKFEISGENNKLHSSATTNNFGHNFFVGGKAFGGTVEFIIGGKNNTLLVDSIAWIGTERSDGDAQVFFKVEGTGHSIRFNNNLNFRKTALDQTTVIFAADKDGTSTISAKALSTFTADLEIDFTNFVGDESGIYEINLISADSDWSSRASRFVGNSEDYTGDANVLTGDNMLSWEIKYEENSLKFLYTYNFVPEPSTYAAILGALALAFAFCKRRK